jgi:hypothetical protein
MASWMVHLRIAEKLLDALPDLDAEQFAIGNIAPDSGIPNEDWTEFDPPKSISHMQIEEGQPLYQLRDMRFFEEYLKGKSFKDGKALAFRLGYLFHLITDNLWVIQIWRPSKAMWEDQFESEQALVEEVKRDWYGLDFLYVRDNRQGVFQRVFLSAAYDIPYLDFFPAEAIPRQLDYIKTFYQRMDEKVKALYERPYVYLNEERMAQFVLETTETLLTLYALLFRENAAIGKRDSALELLPGFAPQRERA